MTLLPVSLGKQKQSEGNFPSLPSHPPLTCWQLCPSLPLMRYIVCASKATPSAWALPPLPTPGYGQQFLLSLLQDRLSSPSVGWFPSTHKRAAILPGLYVRTHTHKNTQRHSASLSSKTSPRVFRLTVLIALFPFSLQLTHVGLSASPFHRNCSCQSHQ